MNKKLKLDHIYQDDCLKILKKLPSDSIDFIVTSPPYANNRKQTYEGIPISKYVNWFKPISKELLRVLKSDGSFVLNIKERVQNGERGTYVLELILEMKQQGWLWTEEYMWHKKNCYPGKWSNRFRDAWERCLHFTKNRKFKMNQQNVMVPVGEWSKKRLSNLSDTDKIRDTSKVGSGFGKNISNWVGKELVYPSNVLHMATECGNRGHSASFPVELPSWFIKLFTDIDDVVLDPFMGSGTTAIASKNLNRHFVGMELKEEYYQLAIQAIKQFSKTKTSKNKQQIVIP